MSAWLAAHAKAMLALLGTVATALLGSGDLQVKAGTWWPLVAALLTALVVYAVPNRK